MSPAIRPKRKTWKKSSPSPATPMVTTITTSGPPTSSTTALLFSVASRLSRGLRNICFVVKCRRPLVQRALQIRPLKSFVGKCRQQIVQGTRKSDPVKRPPTSATSALWSSVASKNVQRATPQKRPPTSATMLCCQVSPAHFSKGPANETPQKSCFVVECRPQIVQRALQIRPAK